MQWQGDMESGAVVHSMGSEGSVVGGMVVRATVKPEERSTVSVAARTTIKAEDRSAANAKIVVRARVKDEERATVGAKAHGLVNAEGRSAGNASKVDRAHVKVMERATVSTDARTTVNAGNILTGNAINNTIGRATVSPDDRATLMAENEAKIGMRTSVKAEERATAYVKVRTTFGAEGHSDGNANMVDRVTVKAEERTTVEVEDHIAVKTEDYSAHNAGAHLPRSGALVHDIDGTRKERREHAQAVASQKLLELSDEKNRRISDELREIDRRLNDYQMKVSAMDRGCADDGGVAGSWIGGRLFATSEVALVLDEMDPEERQREVGRMNRARRMASRTIYRHSRHAPADAKKMFDRVLGRMMEEFGREMCRKNLARRSASRTIDRHSRHAVGDANKAAFDREALIYSINARVADGQDLAGARQQEIQQLSGAWAKMNPQRRAREIARVRRAIRMDACTVQREQRKALARAMSEESAAREYLNHARNRDRTRAVVAHARAGLNIGCTWYHILYMFEISK